MISDIEVCNRKFDNVIDCLTAPTLFYIASQMQQQNCIHHLTQQASQKYRNLQLLPAKSTMTMYLKPKLDATAPRAAPKGRRVTKKKREKANKKFPAKLLQFQPGEKTRARPQREDAMRMMRATSQVSMSHRIGTTMHHPLTHTQRPRRRA